MSQILSRKSSINVELFVMSRCPDAWSAEHTFLQVIQSSKLKADLAITLHFITNGSNDGCMHGPLECQGNALLLTLQESQLVAMLPFLGEYNSNTSQIGIVPSQHLSDSLTKVNVPIDTQKRLVKQYEQDGLDTVWKSGAYTKSRGARYSATVMIQGRPEVLGVRDSGQWKQMVDGNDGSVDGWIEYFNAYNADASGKAGL